MQVNARTLVLGAPTSAIQRLENQDLDLGGVTARISNVQALSSATRLAGVWLGILAAVAIAAIMA